MCLCRPLVVQRPLLELVAAAAVAVVVVEKVCDN